MSKPPGNDEKAKRTADKLVEELAQRRLCRLTIKGGLLWLLLAMGALALTDEILPDGRQLLDRANISLARQDGIIRKDTVVTSAIRDGQESEPSTTVILMEIDPRAQVARQTCTYNNQPLIMLRVGERGAMKLGDEPWKPPTSEFQPIFTTLGNLLRCEIEQPETEENRPKWINRGKETFNGAEVFVVESEGAERLAQLRMTAALASNKAISSGLPSSLEVLEYTARHWLRIDDGARLRAIQVSRVLMKVPLAGGAQETELRTEATSDYWYHRIEIDIPQEARDTLGPIDQGSSRDWPGARRCSSLSRILRREATRPLTNLYQFW